jgi:hypothetical protein
MIAFSCCACETVDGRTRLGSVWCQSCDETLSDERKKILLRRHFQPALVTLDERIAEAHHAGWIGEVDRLLDERLRFQRFGLERAA